MNYFRSLQSGDDGDAVGNNNKLVWFGLTNNGRSFGSGVGEVPRLIEILGQNLLPVEVLDEEDDAVKAGSNVEMADVVEEVLNSQKKFYEALTGGDLQSMNNILSKEDSNEVSEVLKGGGRVDGWDLCLAEGARPSDMTISGSDVLLVSDTEAYSTTVEFPPNAGLDGATLLAVQRWKRDESGDWKLALHQTIPWCPGSKAGGTLRCDCRGCTALTSTRERRTFGGLIG
uniref:Uncharacterized protein n=1 Tax=Helicotheca tamesis TaxID=374047 RepID=A0A7S2N1F6_9STRA